MGLTDLDFSHGYMKHVWSNEDFNPNTFELKSRFKFTFKYF